MIDFVLQLREALNDPDLQKLHSADVDAAAREAAYFVAVALGRCRAALLAVPSDIAGTLDAPTAIAAAEHARWLAERIKSRFSQFTGQSASDEMVDEFADDDARCSMVLTRHELWAATNAIQEADDALAAEGQCPATLTDQLTFLIEETAALDAMLIPHADELAPAAEFPLLGNLRSSVSDTRHTIPWWLEGVIESAAERRMRIFLNTLPDPKLIERRAQAGASKATQTPGQHDREHIALVASLLSGLTISRTAPAKASEGDVSVQVTALTEGSGKSLTVSIACNTSGRQRVDWEGVPVRLESMHEGSRYYCTLNEDGRASIRGLPLGTYRVQSWPLAIRINDPSYQGGQPAKRSRDRSIRVSVLEDLKTVEVVMNEPLTANARIVGVLVNADGTEALPEREIYITHQGGKWSGTMSLSAAAVTLRQEALAAAADAQFEWLLVFVESV